MSQLIQIDITVTPTLQSRDPRQSIAQVRKSGRALCPICFAHVQQVLNRPLSKCPHSISPPTCMRFTSFTVHWSHHTTRSKLTIVGFFPSIVTRAFWYLAKPPQGCVKYGKRTQLPRSEPATFINEPNPAKKWWHAMTIHEGPPYRPLGLTTCTSSTCPKTSKYVKRASIATHLNSSTISYWSHQGETILRAGLNAPLQSDDTRC